MAYDQIHVVDATSQMIEIALRSSSTGQLLTGKSYGDMTIKYQREGAAAATTVSVVTATKGAYTSGGFVETDIAGLYQFGIPNAALATGAKAVTITFVCTGALDVVKRIVLIGADLRNANSLGLAYLGGDAFTRIGAPNGASISADIADLPTIAEFNARTLVAADYVVISDLPDVPSAASIRTEMDANSTKLASILEDTGTTLDTLIKDVPTIVEFEARTLPSANYSTYAGADTAGTTTLLGRIIGTLEAGSHNPQSGDAYSAVTTLFAGITSVAKWMRGLYRKDAMDATAKSEVNSSGGTFDEATDSLQAIRDTEPLGTPMRGTDDAAQPGDPMTIARRP